jgi:hypothetical protein
MSDLRDFTGKNRKFTGTIGERISTGTTVDRDESFGQGTLRFNTTTKLMEYYDGNIWKSIDAPPALSSISPTTFSSDGSTLYDINITGSGFSTTVTALWIGDDGTEYIPSVVTRNSSTSVTVKTVATMGVANEPYDIKISNSSGLAATLADALDAGATPAFSAATGTLGTLPNGARAASNLTDQTFGPNVDADSTVITYTVTSGSLPSGLSLGTGGNNGTIQGTADVVGTNTTSSFTITASDGLNTNSRAYSITVNAPVVESFTSNGTFTVPAGVSSVDVLIVAGGGGGGRAGGGGAGGLIFMPAAPVTPGGSVPITIGGGGQGTDSDADTRGSVGQDSVFNSPTGVLTAKGGGGGGSSASTGSSGGSGGGGGFNNSGDNGGPASQPGQPGNSGTFGFGNAGSKGGPNPTYPTNSGGGGGGAGGFSPGQDGSFIKGGSGRSYDISGSSVVYAGGGTGAGHSGGTSPGGPGGGGTATGPGSGPNPGIGNGTANRGGGAGGSHNGPNGPGRFGSAHNGGSGIVIVKY